jgi:hypothetical protein
MAEEIRMPTSDPEKARAEIERTRARMSATLDEIEDSIAEKRAWLRDQLDIGARIREKPLRAAGIVLGAGVLLGLITGGRRESGRATEAAIARGAVWEGRARRLLDIARGQEEEIQRLSEAGHSAARGSTSRFRRAAYDLEHESDYGHEDDHRLRRTAHGYDDELDDEDPIGYDDAFDLEEDAVDDEYFDEALLDELYAGEPDDDDAVFRRRTPFSGVESGWASRAGRRPSRSGLARLKDTIVQQVVDFLAERGPPRRGRRAGR